ncbi:DUF2937 family protein [Sulfitobacter sp.]|jgi:hypothetical protein|uniref:DUF2937 family protein n=1 Tax=unclassified Sulfitobacter TaxID=196795 RepID=UPI001B3FC955|nr:DUF2937 family protein [uncultured Sulfitobacter sp.]MBQ0803392.1 DUF2937 family protein [Sulfitobacter sp.]
MILRALTLAGGLAGGAVTSQFPEYSQQYLQRLGGAVDALGQVTADFDASAQAVGLSRDAALAQMTGTVFMDRRRADMTTTFQRYDALSAALTRLEGQGPFMRAYSLPQMRDARIAKAAWDVYQPAVPLNFAGMVFAGVGFVLGALGIGLLLRLLALPFRRRRATAT